MNWSPDWVTVLDFDFKWLDHAGQFYCKIDKIFHNNTYLPIWYKWNKTLGKVEKRTLTFCSTTQCFDMSCYTSAPLEGATRKTADVAEPETIAEHVSTAPPHGYRAKFMKTFTTELF